MLRPYTVPVTLDLLPLLLAALALGIEVDARQLARVVVEDLEPSLARGERTIIEFAGRELPVDPPYHPVGGDPVHLARAGAVGEAGPYVQRRGVGGEAGGFRARPRGGGRRERPTSLREGPGLQ